MIERSIHIHFPFHYSQKVQRFIKNLYLYNRENWIISLTLIFFFFYLFPKQIQGIRFLSSRIQIQHFLFRKEKLNKFCDYIFFLLLKFKQVLLFIKLFWIFKFHILRDQFSLRNLGSILKFSLEKKNFHFTKLESWNLYKGKDCFIFYLIIFCSESS